MTLFISQPDIEEWLSFIDKNEDMIIDHDHYDKIIQRLSILEKDKVIKTNSTKIIEWLSNPKITRTVDILCMGNFIYTRISTKYEHYSGDILLPFGSKSFTILSILNLKSNNKIVNPLEEQRRSDILYSIAMLGFLVLVLILFGFLNRFFNQKSL